MPLKSPAWREFRLWAFDVFVRTFQGSADDPQIALMFTNVTLDDDEGDGRGFTEEWKWVMANAKGGVGIKIAGSARGHHLSGERTKIETWQPRLIAAPGTPLFARSEMDQTWQRAMYQLNVPLSFYLGALTGLQNGQSIWDISAGAMEACKEPPSSAFAAAVELRHVFAVAAKFPDLAVQAVMMRRFGEEVIKATAGKKIHGTGAIPGGVNKNLSLAERDPLLKEVPRSWRGRDRR